MRHCNTIGNCIHQLHVDTGLSSQTLQVPVQNGLTDVPSQSGTFPPLVTYYNSIQNNIIKNNGNPFDCSVMLNHVHRNVRRVALKNVQMPIGFYNIRSPYNTFTIAGVPYTVTPGNYNLTTLLNSMNGLVTPALGTFSVSGLTNIFQYTTGSGIGIVTISGPLLTLLGFTSTGQTGINIVAPNSYIINFDTYVYLYFPDFGTSSKENTLGTFKIPLNVTSGGILQWGDNSQNEQYIVATDKSKYIDRIIVKVIDRYGNLLNNNGLDWSFSLEIVSDA